MHKIYLVTDGYNLFVVPENHPFLFSFKENGITTPFGNRNNVSTGMRYNPKKHRILFQCDNNFTGKIGRNYTNYLRGILTISELINSGVC